MPWFGSQAYLSGRAARDAAPRRPCEPSFEISSDMCFMTCEQGRPLAIVTGLAELMRMPSAEPCPWPADVGLPTVSANGTTTHVQVLQHFEVGRNSCMNHPLMPGSWGLTGLFPRPIIANAATEKLLVAHRQLLSHAA